MEEFREIIEPQHHLVDRPRPVIIKKVEAKVEEKKEVNNTIPSTAFVNKLFANKDYYHEKHNELERERCGDYDGI
jgi:hypothetical protein